MSDRITIDYETGNMLLRGAYRFSLPEKVGERNFTSNVRVNIGKKVRQLYKALRDVSEILKERRLLHFGAKDGYREVDRLPDDVSDSELATTEERLRIRYELKDKLKTVEVTLSGQAKDGLYWLLYTFLHPDSASAFTAGAQDEILWPLAEQIKARKALEKDTGLDTNEVIEINYDTGLEEDKDKVLPFPEKAEAKS